jgi:hypothetical protein
MRDVVQGSFRGGSLRPSVPHVAQGRTARTAGPALSLPPALACSMGQGGQRLPAAVQRKMETAFGTSFDDVRVHVGREAPAIGALAFTCGNHLYFAPGQYDPQAPHGQRLLGHELAHVVQQRAGRVRNPSGCGIAIIQEPGLEAEAERMGLRAASMPAPATHSAARPGPPRAQGSSGIQCKPVKLRDTDKDDREYLALIDDYERLQQYLTDSRHYLPALAALNKEVEEQIKTGDAKRALSKVLLRREQQHGINLQGAPIYTSGLSGADFNRMLKEGVIPKDVGELSRHGEQTHRIQWYIILWNMYGGFRTTDSGRNGFTYSARELLIRSTKVQVPKKNFPTRLDRGANVWHALFDMALDSTVSRDRRSNWREDVVTSADLLGGALHGESSHMANRIMGVQDDEDWQATGRELRRAAPTVSKLLGQNYAKRLKSETEHGEDLHLRRYHRKKLESGFYVEPTWSKGGILIRNPSVKEKAEVGWSTKGLYFTYLGHLLFNSKWDQEGTGFLSLWNKTPDGVVKMRDAHRAGRYWDIFMIAEEKLRANDSNRSPLVRDLYEVLVKIWSSPWQTLNSKLRELGSWDISRR